MAMLDMPLAELERYTGSCPPPDDFDAYWDRALAQLEGTPLEYHITPADYRACGVECLHLWFTGVGGAQIHCKLLRPTEIAAPLPAVMLFHGYQSHVGDWFDKLPYVYGGMVVAAMDTRGQGGLSQDNTQTLGSTHRGHIVRGMEDEDPARLLFRQIFLDTAMLARVLDSLPFVRAGQLAATGFSQGGALAIACAALSPSVKALAPGQPFLSDYRRVWAMDLDKAQDPYRELCLYFRTRDPLHQREERFWRRLDYIDVHHLARRVQAKTLFFISLMDDTCPPSTQFAAYNGIPAPKELRLYPDYAHEPLPGSFDAILQFFSAELQA